MKAVVILPEAKSDLREIAAYIRSGNPQRAETFVNELLDQCAKLGASGETYALVPRWRHLGVRKKPYKSYLIFFLVLEDRVDVLHIIHGARDYVKELTAEWDS